ncbi:hypothetical protein ACLIBH_07865 [Virgibacillus sp. W0430]|uniref:hypothetical protein n=1 Tax=Virgibacillus sp. W0430 TaxID=3391580 RepID=UPI003F46B104
MNKEQEKIRFKAYVERLMHEREQEQIKNDVTNEFSAKRGEGLSSPVTVNTTEDNRLLMEYMQRSNLFLIDKHNAQYGKTLKLRRFFKLRRNQLVEIYSIWGEETVYTVGKVSTIGRDFVMLINLKERIWIPYLAVISANIPYGIPNYSNTHQNFMFDNNYRHKLLHRFGETVAKRDVLRQYFFEESLRTNLETWKDTWIELSLSSHATVIGKIRDCNDKKVTITYLGKKEIYELESIQKIKTIRFLTIITIILKKLVHFIKI